MKDCNAILSDPFRSPVTRRHFLQIAGSTLAGGIVLGACGPTSRQSITLQQWYHQYGEAGTQDAAKRYASDYTKSHAGINVNVGWIGGDYATVVVDALLSPNGPDVFEYGAIDPDMVALGLLEPLDDLVPSSIKQDMSASALQQYTYNDGHLYAIKMIGDPQCLFYRKSMLAKVGIDPSSLTTLDALLKAAKKLTTGNTAGLYILGTAMLATLQYMMVWSSATDLITNQQATFANDRTASAFTKLSSGIADGSVSIDITTDYWQPPSFIAGKSAIALAGMWGIPTLIKEIGDDFGAIPWPALDAQGKPVSWIGGWAAMVSARSKHVAEAKALVKSLWIDNVSVQQDWSLQYGFHIPQRLSVQASADKLKTGVAADVVTLTTQYARFLPIQWTAPMGLALNNAVTNILNYKANATDELSKASDSCQTLLSQQKS
jgi:multiple sugar transport system substrate-binding protein